MDNKTKKILLIIISILFVVFDWFLSFNLMSNMMSGGNRNVENILYSGQTAKIVTKDIDISQTDSKININDKVYLTQGVNNRIVISHNRSKDSVLADVIDINGDKARVNIYYNSTEKKKTPGLQTFQILIFIMLIVIYIYVLSKTDLLSCLLDRTISFNSNPSRNKKRNKYGDQGSAEEANKNDLRDLMGNDGLNISKNIRLSAKKSYEHVLVLGPTGSGKTSSFFIPNLLDLDGTQSAVITDPKKELLESSRQWLESLGYNIVVVSPLESDVNEFKYNPLSITKDSTEIRDLAQLILVNGNRSVELMTKGSSSGAEWINMAIPLLAAAMSYVAEKGKQKSIFEAINIILKDNLDEMERKFEQVPSAYMNFLIFKSSSESEKTMGSIKSVLASDIQIFTDPKIIDFTTPELVYNENGEKVINEKKLFNPLILREKPTALFVCVDEMSSVKLMPLMAVFYTQLFTITMQNKGYPIFYMLDEFANIGIIPMVDTVATTGRSKEISLSLGLQSITQLQENYGKESADNLLNNLKTKMVYGGLSGDSAKYISDLCGYSTTEVKSISNNKSSGGNFISNIIGNQGVSISGARRELYTTDEVRRLGNNEVLIIIDNRNPVRDTKNSWFTQKKYKNKINT